MPVTIAATDDRTPGDAAELRPRGSHSPAAGRGGGLTTVPEIPSRPTADDVVIGYDGKPRCSWAGAGDTASGRYHDEVWGTRTYDESALFEALTLGVFEAGLSWSIVFGKRDGFQKAFHAFDIAKVAAMTERDVDRLVRDPSIIRNRAKIQATVANARAMRSASPAWPRSLGPTRLTANDHRAISPTSPPRPLRRRRSPSN